MIWRFTIINSANVSLVIDEPVGWDANVCDIIRDPLWHGIFFNVQGDTFQFYGKAREVIKAEYEEKGAEGNLVIVMEEDCGAGFVEFNRGKLDFNNYEEYCGETCYVKIPLENTDEVMMLRNRLDQKVNLETTIAFDETTALPPYTKLPFSMALPSKAIVLQDKAEWVSENVTSVSLDEAVNIQYDSAPSAWNVGWFQVVPQIDSIVLNEFGTFGPPTSPEFNFICGGTYDDNKCPDLFKIANGNIATTTDRTLYFDWTSCTPALYNDNNANNFTFIKKFNLSFNYTLEFNLKAGRILFLNKCCVIYRKDGTYDVLHNVVEQAATGGSSSPGGYVTGSYWGAPSTHTISDTFTINDIHLNEGDYLFIFCSGLAQYINTDATAGIDFMDVTGKAGHVVMTSLSKGDPTYGKVFAINETLSRVTEAITNNKLKVFSNYFGRTDAQPYPSLADGCGGLEVVTNGIRIRGQENKIPGSVNLCTLSLQDLFNGLNPIHNIGFGIEPDPNRANHNLLRVEGWEYFFNDSVLLSCTDINNIIVKFLNKEAYSTFTFGYSKWEAEEFNGLDEFLTKRVYRSTQKEINNAFNQLSIFIAAGYTIEVTRRQGNTNSKDWKYDNDTFIICCTRHKDPITTDAIFTSDNLSVQVPINDANGAFFQVCQTVQITGSLHNNTTADVVYVGPSVPGYLLIIFAPMSSITTETASGVTFTSLSNSVNMGVELGNITSPSNIIDPATIYNFRISPIRNAMRWLNKVLETYRQFTPEAKFIFTSGDGNYFAAGEMTSTDCRQEKGVITENEILNSDLYLVDNNAKPFLRPERIIFNYPMSSMDFKKVKANPHGMIYFSNNCLEGYGYIDQISYKPEEGVAKFTLIPKIL